MSVLNPVISSIDGASRRIYLKQGVGTFNWIDDIYHEYLELRALDETLQSFTPLMEARGGEARGNGNFIFRYLVLLEGTRIVPYNEGGYIAVTGEAVNDNAETDPNPIDVSTITYPIVIYLTPSTAELIRVEDFAKIIANAVLDEVA